MKRSIITGVILIGLLSGCSHIDFNADSDGLKYYEPTPYLMVQVDQDCKWSSQVILLPSVAKHLKLENSFWGSSNLSIGLTQGLVTSAGQVTDTKIPEFLTSLTGLYSAVTKPSGLTPIKCTSSAALYKVNDSGSLEPVDLPLPVATPVPPAPPAPHSPGA